MRLWDIAVCTECCLSPCKVLSHLPEMSTWWRWNKVH